MIASTSAERINVPGYSSGEIRDVGFSGRQRRLWRELFDLKEPQLEFWAMHKVADLEHSNLGWQTVGRYAEELGMADAVVEAARLTLGVWGRYWNGIGELGDAIEAGVGPSLVIAGGMRDWWSWPKRQTAI